MTVQAETLRVGGLTRCTGIDFPGQLAAVVFCQGCPWRCSYCHNRHLLDAQAPGAIAWHAVLSFLEQRQALLDAVVFSGGEPALQTALPDAIAQVRALGFRVGLHTAGVYPQRLAQLLPLVDWVGLDVKGPWERIDAITGTPGSAGRVRASLDAVLASGVAHECRTTWDASLFSREELDTLGAELTQMGVQRWSVQTLRTSRT